MNDEETLRALQAENAELKAALAKAERQYRMLEAIIEAAPGITWETEGALGQPNYRVNYVSPQVESILGFTREEWADPPTRWLTRIHPDDKELILKTAPQINAQGGRPPDCRYVKKDGTSIWTEGYIRAIRDESGAVIGRAVFALDVTERKAAQEAEAKLKEEIIRVQATAIAELSTPLIPISSEVVVMPLIGSIDQQRSERVVQALLEGIAKTRARVAILDITGVPGVDTLTADTLVRATRAVKLLGAEIILTGMRPEVAQTLVGLDVNLEGIVTRGTLESGIAYANRATKTRVRSAARP